MHTLSLGDLHQLRGFFVFELLRLDLCGRCGNIGVHELLFWLLPVKHGLDGLRHLRIGYLLGDSFKRMLRLRSGDLRNKLGDVGLLELRCGQLHLDDGGERLRVVLRGHLPIEHGVDELQQLPRRHLCD